MTFTLGKVQLNRRALREAFAAEHLRYVLRKTGRYPTRAAIARTLKASDALAVRFLKSIGRRAPVRR